MHKTRNIALFALASLAFVLAAVYGYLRWDNYGALRDIIAERVERSTGQQLTFNGPVSLEMGADSFLNFRDVVLTNPDWQMLRSTISVDQGRIGLDVPNVLSGGIGTIVELSTVKVELDRPAEAADLPQAPAPGTVLAAPEAPPLPKFDELRAERLIVMAKNLLGDSALDFKDLKVAPETEERVRMDVVAAQADDVSLTIVTDEISNGRAWTFTLASPRSDMRMIVEASSGRKLALRGIADASKLDVGDIEDLMTRSDAPVTAEAAKPFVPENTAPPVGWLQLIRANLDIRLADVTWGDASFAMLRAEGRADNGWLSLAPFEAEGRSGVLRGFAVLDAGSLPVETDIALTAENFQPFRDGAAKIDGRVRLSGRATDVAALRAPDGLVEVFGTDIGFEHLSILPPLGMVLPTLERAHVADDASGTALCAVLSSPVSVGRLHDIDGQMYSNKGRMSARGSIDMVDGAADMDFAIEPKDSDVAYLNAVGSLKHPAVAEDMRATPWLTFDLPEERLCSLLRRQFDVALNGR
ncbi:MAG: hypothetical protein AAF562_03310 [Pseudomonadota bacterium]